MSRKKIKKNKARVRRPRGAHARKMDTALRAQAQAYMAELMRPVRPDKELVDEDMEAALAVTAETQEEEATDDS